MARQRNPVRDKAKDIWLKSKGAKPLVEIATELNKSSSTIRKWKSLDSWEDELKGSAPLNKRSAPLKNNQNAVENKGGAPPKNHNAVTHGLYAKYLPAETLEIAEAFNEVNPVDLIWDSITTQYALILQTHKIMQVSGKDDHSKEVSGWSSGEGGSSERYAFQYSWDKHASYMNTIARAMGTLSNFIKQFILIADEADERRLKLELMQAQIGYANSQNAKLQIENNEKLPSDEVEDDGFLDAIKAMANDKEVWNDGGENEETVS